MMQDSWSKAASHYAKARSYKPESSEILTALEKFCLSIASKDKLRSLYWTMSHHDLRIFQVKLDYPKYLSSQYLLVLPSFDENMVEFRFVDTQREERQWSRTEKANEDALIQRLIGFVNQVGWAQH